MATNTATTANVDSGYVFYLFSLVILNEYLLLDVTTTTTTTTGLRHEDEDEDEDGMGIGDERGPNDERSSSFVP
jgi:hypothetical protein